MMEPEINFHYEIEDFSLEKAEAIKKWLLEVGKAEEKEISLLNYIFCSDEYLLEINKEYLNHDFYTDIISFPLKENPIEGDIFISVERIIENAQEFRVPFEEELRRVMVHGLLHFMAYDDHNDEDIKMMRFKENGYIDSTFFTF